MGQWVNLLPRDTFIKAYRYMLLARILDDKFASLYRTNKIHGGVFLGRGQEALSASIGVVLGKGDVFAPSFAMPQGVWPLASRFSMRFEPIWGRRWVRCADATEMSTADAPGKGCFR